jgi:hypothetical protein
MHKKYHLRNFRTKSLPVIKTRLASATANNLPKPSPKLLQSSAEQVLNSRYSSGQFNSSCKHSYIVVVIFVIPRLTRQNHGVSPRRNVPLKTRRLCKRGCSRGNTAECPLPFQHISTSSRIFNFKNTTYQIIELSSLLKLPK